MIIERPVVTEEDIESYIEQLETNKAEITEAVTSTRALIINLTLNVTVNVCIWLKRGPGGFCESRRAEFGGYLAGTREP